MSMRYYAMSGTGLFLTCDEMEEMLERYNTKHPDKDADEGTFEFMSEDEKESFIIIIDNLNEGNGIMSRLIPFDGDIVEDYGFVLWTDFSTTAEAFLKGRSYKNIQEIVDEIKAKVAPYLPEEFDYRAHIGEISTASWG